MAALTQGVPYERSKKSVKLQHDTFIFLMRDPYAKVIAGFNQTLMQAEACTVYRWLRLVTSFTKGFQLRPVSLKHGDMPFRYSFDSIGEPVMADANIFQPGYYGWFWEGRDLHDLNPGVPFIDGVYDQSSFAELICLNPSEKELELYELDTSLKEAVERRDGDTCYFTGTPRAESNCDLECAWVIPPPYSVEVASEGPEFFQRYENAVLMRKVLVPHWYKNEFAIDIEDENRIVRFRKLPPEIDALLPRNLPLTPSVVTASFLRRQLQWCLRVNVEGGDISEDFSEEKIMDWYQDMGLAAFDDDMMLERAPEDHEEWNTTLGRAVREMLERKQAN